MNRAQPFAEYLAEGWFNIFVWRNKIGEIWGNFLKKSAKTVVSGSKTGKNGRFLRSQLASDSVIRWFESSYPSQFGIIRTSSLSERRSDYFYIWTILVTKKVRCDTIVPAANDCYSVGLRPPYGLFCCAEKFLNVTLT